MAAIVPAYLSPQYSAQESLEKLAAGSKPYTRSYEKFATEGTGFWSFEGKGYWIATLVYGIFKAVSRATTLSPVAMALGNSYTLLWCIYSVAVVLISGSKKEVFDVQAIYQRMYRYVDAKHSEKVDLLAKNILSQQTEAEVIAQVESVSKKFDEGKLDSVPQTVTQEHRVLRKQVEAILKQDPPVAPVYTHAWNKPSLFSDTRWDYVEAEWLKLRNSCHRYYYGFPIEHTGLRTYMQVYRDPNMIATTYKARGWS